MLRYINEKDALVERTAVALKTNLVNEIDKKAEAAMEEQRDLEKKIEDFQNRLADAAANDMLAGVRNIGDIRAFIVQRDNVDVNQLKNIGDKMKERHENSLVVIGSENEGKITFIAMASKGAVSKGVHCGNIIKEITAIAGGRGGGKPDMAQGGGKDADKIDNALAVVDEIVARQIG